MLERVEIFIRRLLNYFSRSRLLIKLFGLSKFDEDAFRKGLIMIQIDALSRKQLEKAIKDGKVPFLKSLLEKEHYQLQWRDRTGVSPASLEHHYLIL